MLKDNIWYEKHRPQKIMDIVSPHSESIKRYIESNTIPNFLFYSRVGGTGKSSMAKAIIKELDCDVMTLNASAERSIDNIRNNVKEFARTKSTNGKKRCVFMDEAEKLTKDAMDALKNMIEDYTENTFYIFTTNNIEKISQPMQSRFTAKYEFVSPNKEQIYLYLKNICEVEGLVYDEVSLNKVIDKHYPSVRECVNVLQDCKMKMLSVNDSLFNSQTNVFRDCFNNIIKKEFSELYNKIQSGVVDVSDLNKWLFNHIIESDINKVNVFKAIQILGQNEINFNIGADKKIVFISSLPRLILSLKGDEK